MKEIVVVGGQVLEGEVRASGSKNAALALLPVALLTDEECILHNVPDVSDVHVMVELMRALGARCHYERGTVVVKAKDLSADAPPAELVSQIRGSIYVAGALLTRLGQACINLPGGCALNRRVDFHVDAFIRMGASVTVNENGLKAQRLRRRLQGTKIPLDPRWRSVGTTINSMLAACLAEGTTLIENAAREPEVVNCAQFLKASGAHIKGEGSSSILVEGVERLHGGEFSVINDRIEAGTLLLAGAITGGSVTVVGVPEGMLESFLDKLEETGVIIECDGDRITEHAPKRPNAVEVTTLPFPGFPTDLQPPFVSLLSVAEGVSVVTETIHEGRLKYTDHLVKMGAQIEVKEPEGGVKLPCSAWITGVKALHGDVVQAFDLRAGAGLVLAGLVAEGETVVQRAELIHRGYENMVEKLRALGGNVRHREVPSVKADEHNTMGTKMHPVS